MTHVDDGARTGAFAAFVEQKQIAVRGQFLLALSWSPLAALAAIAAVAHVAWTALRLVGLPFAPRIEATPALRWTAAAALAANWLFVVLSGRA